MQRGRGGRDAFFDFSDPFAGFGGFGGFGGLGGHRGLMSSFFGGRDPFDDPFFTNPFGGMFGTSLFGPSGSPFPGMQPSGFLEHQAPEPKKSRGPIIEELNSDDEKEDADKDKKENPRKHGRAIIEPYIEDPSDQGEGKKMKYLQHTDDDKRSNVMQSQPQAHSFTFQSSTVTYGGSNRAYYTSSRTRRMGSDGVTMEECKEADTATRQATNRISRGLHNKGHSIERKLKADGKVDTMQTLHNIDQDELAGFEKAWNVNASRHLPGWSENFGGFDSLGSSGQNGLTSRGGWALPSTEIPQDTKDVIRDCQDKPGPSRSECPLTMKADPTKRTADNTRGRRKN